MNEEIVKERILKVLENAEVDFSGDGYHYQLTVITNQFASLNKVKRQQLVYQALHEFITSGELHAISLVTLTPEEKKASLSST